MSTSAMSQPLRSRDVGAMWGSVDLYWIPLGAGGHSVRFNGMVYEAISATVQHRSRCQLYHSALSLELPHGNYVAEMTPVPDRAGAERGVVGEGPVGLRTLRRVRIFRYEIRRWRDGIVPDLEHAVASPVRVTNDGATAQRVFDLLPSVPRLTWGRDEALTGDMWSCNSITSWTLANAGVDLDDITCPPRARAPGWQAGLVVAARSSRPASPAMTFAPNGLPHLRRSLTVGGDRV